MYFVPHFGHAKVYETSIWTPCFQILAKTMVQAAYLNDLQQDVVKHEPYEYVYQHEAEAAPVEEIGDGPGRQQASHHALGDGLQEDGVGDHSRPQLDPSVSKKDTTHITQRLVWYQSYCN